MALIRHGAIIRDCFTNVAGESSVPAEGAVIVSLEQWRAHPALLAGRRDLLGIRLRSDQSPALIAAEVRHFAVIALEFPVFRDGRAYTYARLLRERWDFTGELRAVGDVLLEQLHFMQRAGFDSFELASADPVRDWQTANAEFSTWYQATGDGRSPARELRHLRQSSRKTA